MAMEQTTLTNRHQQILALIKIGCCLPREIAHELKANKTNISTALKYLLDNNFVVRAKFYGTYVYALNDEMLKDLVQKKRLCYARQMEFEKDIFTQRMKMRNNQYG